MVEAKDKSALGSAIVADTRWSYRELQGPACQLAAKLGETIPIGFKALELLSYWGDGRATGWPRRLRKWPFTLKVVWIVVDSACFR